MNDDTEVPDAAENVAHDTLLGKMSKKGDRVSVDGNLMQALFPAGGPSRNGTCPGRNTH